MARTAVVLVTFSIFLASPAHAQYDGLLLPDDPLQRFLEYHQTQGHLPDAHLTHRPLSAYEAQEYLDSLEVQREQLSSTSRMLLDRYRGVADGPGVETAQRLYSGLYQNGRHVFSAEGEGYSLQVSPLLYMYYGRGGQTRTDDRERHAPFWRNTRGARVSGKVGPIFFDTRLEENQRRDIWPGGSPWAEHPPGAWRTGPRLNSTKFYPENQVYDYFFATGTVGFRSPHFEVRLGRDKNLWGPGETSLFLSDYPSVYDQLQIRTSFWRVQYTNLFTQMADPLDDGGPSFTPHKFGIFHRLALQLPHDIEVELFESVIARPDTSAGHQTRGGFELPYLNPIIFYRAVEHDRGSPDNVTLGTGFSWGALDGLRLYSQFLITELVVDEIGSGSWLNKWGWLAGAHVTGLPVDDLSLRVEFARIRPYVYMHRSTRTAYTHYDDVLGHPIGPNARDIALFADYQITPRIRAAFNVAYTQRGRDPEGANLGTDVRKSYDDRDTDDAPFLVGIRQDQLLFEAHAAYELLPQLYLEGAVRAETFTDDVRERQRYAVPYVTLRWGLPYESRRY